MSVTYADPDAYWVAQNFRKKVGQNFRNPPVAGKLIVSSERLEHERR